MSFEIIGIGSYLPPRVVTNEEVGRVAGISSQQIKELFEIDERRWVRQESSPKPAPGQNCSDLAVAAARAALADASLEPADVDTIVAVSMTPDYVNPPLDYLVGGKLGVGEFFGIPMLAPCTGLFRAAEIVDALLATGRAETVLLVAAEAISPFFRFGPEVAQEHRLNSVLYADGAGALVISKGREGVAEASAIHSHTTGREEAPGLSFKGMMSAEPPEAGSFESMAYLGHHNFRRVLRRGSALAHLAAKRVMAEVGASIEDVRFLLTHQATGNIQRIGAPLGIPAYKIPVNIGHVGNTISASILILLDELKCQGEIAGGDLLVLHTAESSSWSHGGMALRWR